MNTTHIMVDLETWGTTPGSDIRSIGAVVFDPIAGTLGDEFYVNVLNPATGGWINGASDYRYPLTRDPDTVEWWAKQSPAAQMRLTTSVVDLKVGLQQFATWWDDHVADALLDRTTFWAHGPHFDEAILAACYRATGLQVPWHYRAPRDCRTIFDAAEDPCHVPFEGVEHDALADAKNQARRVILAYRLLGLGHDQLFVSLGEHEHRTRELLRYNNEQVEKRRAATALLSEAATLFRFYETGHRAKVEPEDGTHVRFMLNSGATAKAERNAEIAGRIETFLSGIHQ